MKSVGVFDAKNRLSEICEQVASTGEPCLVTRRGKAWVQIIAVKEEAPASVWGSVEEGEARYGPLMDEFELPPRSISENRPSPI